MCLLFEFELYAVIIRKAVSCNYINRNISYTISAQFCDVLTSNVWKSNSFNESVNDIHDVFEKKKSKDALQITWSIFMAIYKRLSRTIFFWNQYIHASQLNILICFTYLYYVFVCSAIFRVSSKWPDTTPLIHARVNEQTYGKVYYSIKIVVKSLFIIIRPLGISWRILH